MGERPLQRRDEGLAAMGPLELRRWLPSSVGSFVVPAAAAAPQEGLGHRTEIEEGQLGGGPWSQGPGGPPGRTAVVGVVEAEPAGSHEAVPGDLAAAVGDDEGRTLDVQLDPFADDRTGHAVSRRAEADRAQLVDGPGLDRADGRSQVEGSEPSSVRSMARRSSGTAMVSLWTRPLTSAHQATAAVFAAPRSAKGPSPTSRSDLA